MGMIFLLSWDREHTLCVSFSCRIASHAPALDNQSSMPSDHLLDEWARGLWQFGQLLE